MRSPFCLSPGTLLEIEGSPFDHQNVPLQAAVIGAGCLQLLRVQQPLPYRFQLIDLQTVRFVFVLVVLLRDHCPLRLLTILI